MRDMGKEELRATWIAALRSGDYKQTDGSLCSDGKYCCLGVLCDVSGLGKWDDEDYRVEINGIGFSAAFELPNPIRQAAGLNTECGEFEATDQIREKYPNIPFDDLGFSSLANLNDSKKWTFDQIADFLEENPDIVFGTDK